MQEIAEIIDVQPVRLLWFEFSQNNSGGYFIEDDQVCELVYIQAVTAAEAIAKAEALFADKSEYCSCCGERWSYWVDDTDGTPIPMLYGEPLETTKASTFRKKAKLHYLDGHIEDFVLGTQRPLSIQ